MVIGIANVIPGVSGGTMMVSMGIYDKLISSITHLFSNFKKSFMTLLPIGIGMIAGILGLARIIEWMFNNAPVQTNLFFIGLILGGLPMIFRNVKGKKMGISGIIGFVFFFALVAGMSFLRDVTGSDADISINLISIIKLFGVGIIAAATMVIPGVSGSMMLMLLGYYNPIVGTISRMVDALIARDFGTVFSCVGILLPFGIGVVVGIFAIAKLIEILLKRYPSQTFSVILGLVLASPVAILMETGFATANVVTILCSVVTCAVGFVVALKLGD
jgi:putative membrane protein